MKIKSKDMRKRVLLFVMDRYEWELNHGPKYGYDHLWLIPLINAILSDSDIEPHYYADVVIKHFNLNSKLINK